MPLKNCPWSTKAVYSEGALPLCARCPFFIVQFRSLVCSFNASRRQSFCTQDGGIR